MPSPLLILAFCAFLPASTEADMTPVLAPAILVEEGALAGDCAPAIEIAEVADAGALRTLENGEIIVAPDLGPALVVDSNN